MPDVYLNPSDLSPVQVDQVLRFLNRATGAQQLARDIEFPAEPDIGVRLGQRLLDARAALGGAFSDIAQVRNVRLIGPERFTEICVAALGLDPTRWVDLFFGASPLAAPAESGLAVTLEVRPRPQWLGLPLTVVVRVADQGGVARAATEVTVQTGAGRLLWMYGFTRVEGQAITVITGADGSAVLDLLRPPTEPLSGVQQAALRVALQALDVHAGDPLKLEADFRALADLYLLERSYNLRRAIDVFVRDSRETMLAALNPGAWRLAWPLESVLLQADALAPGAGGSSSARAVATAVWKNWVGAWLEFLGDRLREADGLDAGFAQSLERAKGPEVVNEMLAQAQAGIAARPGRSALWVGQKIAAVAATKVASSPALAQSAPEVQAAVLAQLPVATQEITPTTLGTYTLVQTAPPRGGLTVNADLVANLDQLTAQVSALTEQNNALTAQLGSVQADVVDLRTTLELPSIVVGPPIAPGPPVAVGPPVTPVTPVTPIAPVGPTVNPVRPTVAPVAPPIVAPVRRRKRRPPGKP